MVFMRMKKILHCLHCGVAVEAPRQAHSIRCKPCKSAYQLEWARANKDKVRKARERYYASRDMNAYQRAWRKKNPERIMSSRLKSMYGLSLADYRNILASQGGGCAICGTSVCDKWSRLSVDHHHASKTIRGLLCDSCNLLLGKAKDSPDLLRKAAAYLEKSEHVIAISS